MYELNVMKLMKNNSYEWNDGYTLLGFFQFLHNCHHKLFTVAACQ